MESGNYGVKNCGKWKLRIEVESGNWGKRLIKIYIDSCMMYPILQLNENFVHGFFN